MTDKRKRRWIVLDIQFPRGHSTQELRRKLDSTAPLLWAAVLCAAKRSKEQGTIEWFTDSDIWNELGLDPDDFNYTWDEFIRATGQLKMTAKRRSRHLQKVVITRWADWQEAARTGSGREWLKSEYPNVHGPKSDAWKEQEARLNRAKPAPNRSHEIESEIERETNGSKTSVSDPEQPLIPPPQSVTNLLSTLTTRTEMDPT